MGEHRPSLPAGRRSIGGSRRPGVRRGTGVCVVFLLAALTLASAAASTSFAQASGRLEHSVRHRRRRRHHKKKPSATIASPCAYATTPASKASTQAIDGAVVCLVNLQRSQHGLPALHEQSQLDASAQSWTDHMVSSGDFTHGTDFAARIAASGYAFQSAGEDIASGYRTPLGVVNAWMASTGHCQNILAPIFNDIGAGADPHPVAGVASGGATWTLDFGLALLALAPSNNWGPADGCPY